MDRLDADHEPKLSLADFKPSARGLSGSGERPLLVCFSHLRWNFVWQRPQHLLGRAARAFDVVFFEEPIFSDEQAPSLRVTKAQDNVEVVVPLLPTGQTLAADRAQRLLLEEFLRTRTNAVRVFWYYTPAAIGFSGGLPRDLTIYDNMDELSAFRGAPPELIRQEQDLFAKADLVFTGGRSLYEAKRTRHPDVHCFPSSIDAAHYAQARRKNGVDPVDQANIARPRIGFFGVIDERFDCDFLTAFADLRPDWQLVMIGPVLKIDPAVLPRRPNIHWLGQKDYKALPSYLRHWDLGLMAFALNESTRFISPTKTPEFLAAGVPVLSTPIVDVVKTYGEAGLVEIVSTPEEAVEAAARAMARPRDEWLRQVDRQLATNSWDRTWERMQDLILSGLRLSKAERPAMSAALARSA